MHQMSQTLQMMVVKAALEAHYRETVPVDTAELEGALKRALGELQRSRPRIVEFAPCIALRRVLDGLQKVANRITLGLVLAALIVGAALMMRVETSFKILGYPGLPTIFFLLAALAGLILVASIVFTDEKPKKKEDED